MSSRRRRKEELRIENRRERETETETDLFLCLTVELSRPSIRVDSLQQDGLCVFESIGSGRRVSPLGGSSGLGHHIVSLTSTSYGLLTIDPPTTHTDAPTPPLFALISPLGSEPEVINSWELMAGLDCDNSRFSPSSNPKPPSSLLHTFAKLDSRISPCKDNHRPVRTGSTQPERHPVLKPLNSNTPRRFSVKYRLEDFKWLCPPSGQNRLVVYTTTLRGVRKTFEACNAVRATLAAMGVVVNERDVSMHSGYREELRELVGAGAGGVVPPRVFIKGRYIGGAEEVLRINEEGGLVHLVDGVPRMKCGVVCEGCGGVGFLPCFQCSGSCKLLVVLKEEKWRRVIVRCSKCNENGLVVCPLCS